MIIIMRNGGDNGTLTDCNDNRIDKDHNNKYYDNDNHRLTSSHDDHNDHYLINMIAISNNNANIGSLQHQR